MLATEPAHAGPRAARSALLHHLILASSHRIDRALGPAAVSGPELALPKLILRNPPAAVERRLRRLGHTLEQARALADSTAPGLESQAAPLGLVLEQVLGRNALMPVGYLEAGAAAARPVARVHVFDDSG